MTTSFHVHSAPPILRGEHTEEEAKKSDKEKSEAVIPSTARGMVYWLRHFAIDLVNELKKEKEPTEKEIKKLISKKDNGLKIEFKTGCKMV